MMPSVTSRHQSSVRSVLNPRKSERYWEQVPLVYRKDHYTVELRECLPQDIIEIDTFRELKAIDKIYDV